MQKGLATLEIILAIMIIGVLVKFAVPKAAHIIDAVALDYETKRFYSELRFVQQMSKSTPTVNKGFGQETPVTTNSHPTLFIDCKKNFYQIFKDTYTIGTKPIREPHYFSNGVKIRLKSRDNSTITINFDSEGKVDFNPRGSDSLILTSRRGKNKFIVVNSVGRIRGALDNQ